MRKLHPQAGQPLAARHRPIQSTTCVEFTFHTFHRLVIQLAVVRRIISITGSFVNYSSFVIPQAV